MLKGMIRTGGSLGLVLVLLAAGPEAGSQDGTGFIVLRLLQGTGPATVSVDGATVATLSTHEITVEQPIGPHDVAVQAAGYDPFRQRVTVPPGDVVVIEVRLIPTAARITEDPSMQGSTVQALTSLRLVHLEPVNVGIQVNGRQLGRTPATLDVPVGDNDIRLGDVALCLRSLAATPGFVRVRHGSIEEMRGVEQCSKEAALAGTWIGEASNATFGISASIRVVFRRTSKVLTGDLFVSPPLAGSGPCRGTVDGSKVLFTSRGDTGIIHWEATLVGNSRMEGTYLVEWPSSQRGTWWVAR